VSGKKKPKEFWIQYRYLHYEADTEKILDDDIHVIEYSAYEQLKAENKRLVEINDRALSSAPFQEVQQLKSKLETAKQTCDKIKDKFIKPDHEFEPDGCECVVCGSLVDVDDNDWENGIDACWECKASAYDDIVIAVRQALKEIEG